MIKSSSCGITCYLLLKSIVDQDGEDDRLAVLFHVARCFHSTHNLATHENAEKGIRRCSMLLDASHVASR